MSDKCQEPACRRNSLGADDIAKLKFLFHGTNMPLLQFLNRRVVAWVDVDAKVFHERGSTSIRASGSDRPASLDFNENPVAIARRTEQDQRDHCYQGRPTAGPHQ